MWEDLYVHTTHKVTLKADIWKSSIFEKKNILFQKLLLNRIKPRQQKCNIPRISFENVCEQKFNNGLNWIVWGPSPPESPNAD